MSWGFQTCSFLVTGSCNVPNQGVYLSWILFKIRWKIGSNMLNEKSDWGTPILNCPNLLNWIGRSYFIRTIWWNPQHKINYLSLLHEAKHYQLLVRLLRFMKLPVLLCKIDFSFVPGNEFPRNQIIFDTDLVIWSIYLPLA